MTCAKLQVTATIVAPSGERFTGTNAVANPQASCPRGDLPTGQGYELCASVCGQFGHAEAMACKAAGERARGGILYLEGHSYACEPCRQTCAEHGIGAIVIGSPPPVPA
jgi:deoxycytidylate deaminase